ncbi:MAG TPA: hypothetical protein VG034_22770 [Acidimicrobiia bacterium]|nr:hypothetical protein [Acidimicrobiia bacterium]
MAVVAAGGLAACDESKTTSTATGTAATAPADSSSTASTAAQCTFTGATEAARGGGDAPTRLLTDVRVGAHGCYERVTFEFKPQKGDADGPVAWKAAYQAPPITEDGSGRRVQIKGSAFLVVTMTAAGADLSQEAAPATYTGPASIEAADATRIQQVRRTGDFEAVLTWVIGLDKKRPFHVTTEGGPARVIVDVGD